jgi:hypothetical protein
VNRWIVALVLVGLLLPVPAWAQSGALVHLDLSCPQLAEEDVRRVLAAELGTDLVHWDSSWVTVVKVSCDDTAVRVQVRDPVTRKQLDRNLDLASVPERSRERLVALATAEMVIASWAELEVVGSPAIEPTGAPPPPEVVDAAREIVADERTETAAAERQRHGPQRHGRTVREQAQHRLLPLLSLRSFVNHPGTLVGGGARYGAELRRVFSWSVDGLIEGGQVRGERAPIDLVSSTVAGRISFSYPGKMGAIRGGAGLRFGVLRARVEADAGDDTNSTVVPWGWPMLVTSIDIVLAPKVLLELAGEGGYVLLPAAGGEPALEGVWLSGQLGIGGSW